MSTGLFVFLVGLLVALFVGFRWPVWWIAVIPIVIAACLTLYTVLTGDWQVTPSGDNEGAIEFLGILALTLVAELALCAGAALRFIRLRRKGG